MESRPKEILLREYAPKSMLEVPAHEINRPRFDVIDSHNHLCGGVFGDSDPAPRFSADRLVELMDSVNVKLVVDLDGGWGPRLQREIDHYQKPYPDRFAVFAGFDFDNFANDPKFGETEAKRLRESVGYGARGLKVWKVLGLRLRDHKNNLIAVNDQRLDPIWETAGELGIPVMIHVADPRAFFEPLDRFNERWEELQAHPDWHFYPTRPRGETGHPDFPSFEELMDQFEDMLTRHQNTTFIGAHVGCYAENLAWVGRVLDRSPNFYVDISERIQELGRQPYTARDFIVRNQDRVLFGTDNAPNVNVYRRYFRFLETQDEYFSSDSEDGVPKNGRWMIYGLDLPDDVLRKVYYENAHKALKLPHTNAAT